MHDLIPSTIKNCACGRQYDHINYRALHYVGRMDQDTDGDSKLEVRQCTCGSSIAMVLAPREPGDSVLVHGTYPYDSRSTWRKVKQITVEEASKLTGVPMKEPQKGSEDIYLWLNKGYIILGAGGPGLSALQVAALEEMFGLGEKAYPLGVQAVYLHDGQYSLIQRV